MTCLPTVNVAALALLPFVTLVAGLALGYAWGRMDESIKRTREATERIWE